MLGGLNVSLRANFKAVCVLLILLSSLPSLLLQWILLRLVTVKGLGEGVSSTQQHIPNAKFQYQTRLSRLPSELVLLSVPLLSI
ncbi:hypothetical protein PM082_020634 [Marasmius tenuissimus]|nr:hypothetical protein PM082_020634 [Marasmius tenuissimus]